MGGGTGMEEGSAQDTDVRNIIRTRNREWVWHGWCLVEIGVR